MLLAAFPERLLVRRALLVGLQDEPGELTCLGERRGRRRQCAQRVKAMDMAPLGDQRAGAREPVLTARAPYAGVIRTALRQAGPEGGERRIDFPSLTITALVERAGLGPDPAEDGLGIEGVDNCISMEQYAPHRCMTMGD
jgi:hypothetical protein